MVPEMQTASPQPKFTFTAELTQAIKWIEEKDGVEEAIEHTPAISNVEMEGNLKRISCDLVRCYESRDFLIYALIKWEGKLTSDLTLYYFGKAKGENESKQIPGMKGRIISMEFSHPVETKKNNEITYATLLIMGNEKGFIKIIEFNQKSQLQLFQIDTKAIMDIKVPPPQAFHNHHVFFALLEDYNVYVVGMKGNVLAHFRPTIMNCDTALSLDLHSSMKYMLETTKGGYLILWKINENLFKRLQEHQDEKEIRRIYNVFPTAILHSASIDGIRWASFLGDFIALITPKGVFKIVALNVEEKEEFAILLSYQISKGDTIKDVKLFPKEECLVVVKQEGYNNSVVECIFYSSELLVTNVLRVKAPQMPVIDGVIMSKNFRYVLLWNQNDFLINFTKLFEDGISQHRRNRESLRQLTY